MDPADLERLTDHELRRLPTPRAPRALLPRIIAAVNAAAARPWYQRAWLTWPLGWQVASALTFAAMIVGGAMLLPHVSAAITALGFIAEVRGDVVESTRSVEVASTAVRVLWRTLLAPVVPYAFGVVTLMFAACAVFGTVLNHLVFGRAFR
jgi:hypothetical protein